MDPLVIGIVGALTWIVASGPGRPSDRAHELDDEALDKIERVVNETKAARAALQAKKSARTRERLSASRRTAPGDSPGSNPDLD